MIEINKKLTDLISKFQKSFKFYLATIIFSCSLCLPLNNLCKEIFLIEGKRELNIQIEFNLKLSRLLQLYLGIF